LIQKGSVVRVGKTDKQGTVIELKDSFACVKTHGDIQWHPLTDLVDNDDLFLTKYLQGKFDSLHDFIFTVDSHRLQVAHMWDPLVLASSTRIALYPHQLNAVVWALNNFRIMLADEVGLGKTITALLTINELRVARKTLNRVLYVVPSSLIIKWKNELEKKFRMHSTILTHEYIKSNPDAFHRKNYSYIVSIDFLKRPETLTSIPSKIKSIDCVVVDEAHKAKTGTERYKLVEKLSAVTTRLIFLTATPHDGNDENFLTLMRLLDHTIETPKMAQLIMCRNIKENVIDISGNRVFPPRKSHTIKISLDDDEGDIYQNLEQYLSRCQTSAKTQKERNAMRFVSIIFRKRAASSMYSLRQSLERRRDKLGAITVDDTLKSIQKMKFSDSDLDDNTHDDSDTELYTSRNNIEQEKSEIDVLLTLIDKLHNKDSKIERLLTMIEAFKQKDKNAKLVIFTEYRSTLNYLCTRLTKYNTEKIDGTMIMPDRETALNKFSKPDTDILVCTDAAGEGLDMQFCNMEINYDIPWNPNRLEQRMGRIHRIGQIRNVEYYNFVLSGNKIGADGYVHQLLLTKLENIKTALDDGIYDLLGKMYTQEEFVTLCEKLSGLPRKQWAQSAHPFIEDAATKLYEARQNRKQLLETSIINEFNPETIERLKKHSVDALDIQRFLEAFVHIHKGNVSMLSDNMYKIILSPSLSQALKIGVMVGTYDRELAYSTGHQYFALGDGDIDKIIQHASSVKPLSIIGHSTRQGVLFAFRISIFDGNNDLRDEKITMVFCPDGGDPVEVDAKSIWDYTVSETTNTNVSITPTINAANKKISTIAYLFQTNTDKKLSLYAENFQKFVTSELSAKISLLEKEILTLNTKVASDPSVLEIIHALELQKVTISKNWEEHLSNISKLKNSSYSYDLLGMAIVLPDSEMRTNLLVEKAGMNAVINHERKRASNDSDRVHIIDVSDSSCGYDIESFDGRHIEVKSFTSTGDPSLTSHEWDTARRYGKDYWLYIVENATSLPIIYERQDPYNLYKDQAEHRSARSARWVITGWKHNRAL